jgi:hypothetical protein
VRPRTGGAKGLCPRCYKRHRRGQDPSPKPLRAPKGTGDHFTFSVDKRLLDKVYGLAVFKDLSKAEILRRMIEDWIARHQYGATCPDTCPLRALSAQTK